MICPMVPLQVTLSDPYPRFQGHGVIFRPMNALDVLCAQLTRDLFAIPKFLSNTEKKKSQKFQNCIGLNVTCDAVLSKKNYQIKSVTS